MPPPFPARGCRTPGISRKAWSIPNPGSSKVPVPWKKLPQLGWRRPFGKRYFLAFTPFGIKGKRARGEMEKDAGAAEMQASYPVRASGLPAQVFFAQDAGSKPLPSRQRTCRVGRAGLAPKRESRTPNYFRTLEEGDGAITQNPRHASEIRSQN